MKSYIFSCEPADDTFAVALICSWLVLGTKGNEVGGSRTVCHRANEQGNWQAKQKAGEGTVMQRWVEPIRKRTDDSPDKTRARTTASIL
jgi:hypothetical protein